MDIITKYVVMRGNDKLCVAHSHEELINYLRDAKRMGIKGLDIYHSLEKTEEISLLERLKRSSGSFWGRARDKYGCENIVVMDGEVFYLERSKGNYFIGKRVLKDLTLSVESYEINI